MANYVHLYSLKEKWKEFIRQRLVGPEDWLGNNLCLKLIVIFFTGPADLSKLQIKNRPSNNALHATCQRGPWNGRTGKFHATIGIPAVIQEQIKDKCDFHFEDLSYSTQYTIEVDLAD